MALLPAHVESAEVGTASVDASDTGGNDFWQASLSSNAPFGAQPFDFGSTDVIDTNESLGHNSTFTPSFFYEFVSFYFGCLPDVRSNC
jgi:hypothetical protein